MVDQHAQFIRAARDFYDAGPDAFKPAYEQYGDLLTAAEALSPAPGATAQDGVKAWDHRYHQLAFGEIIEAGDECRRDDGTWVTGICVGEPAPDPAYTSHRVYRRLKSTPTPTIPAGMVAEITAKADQCDRLAEVARSPACFEYRAKSQAYREVIAMLVAAPKQAEQQGVERALLNAADITERVEVVNREERSNGTAQWSEVRTSRPHNGQIAHCADQEDADLIAHLINAALNAPTGAVEKERG